MRADSFTSCTTQLTGFKQYLLSNGPELQKSTWPTPASGSGHVLLLFRLEEHIILPTILCALFFQPVAPK